MKQFIAALVLASTFNKVYAQDEDEDSTPAYSQSCMYCKHQDTLSGFMTSFSYCGQTDECLQDLWNYINRDCNSEWITSKELQLSQCNPVEISCPDFVSDTTKYQTWDNKTWSLTEGAMCTVSVDATQAIARVTFTGTTYLGFEDDFRVDQTLVVPAGT